MSSYRDDGASSNRSHSFSSAFLFPGFRAQQPIVLCFSWPSKSPFQHQHILLSCILCINRLAQQRPEPASATTSSCIITYVHHGSSGRRLQGNLQQHPRGCHHRRTVKFWNFENLSRSQVLGQRLGFGLTI